MSAWVRDHESKSIVRNELDLELEPKYELKLDLKLKEMAQERPLSDIVYPP